MPANPGLPLEVPTLNFSVPSGGGEQGTNIFSMEDPLSMQASQLYGILFTLSLEIVTKAHLVTVKVTFEDNSLK